MTLAEAIGAACIVAAACSPHLAGLAVLVVLILWTLSELYRAPNDPDDEPPGPGVT